MNKEDNNLEICRYEDKIVATALIDISVKQAYKILIDFYNANPFNPDVKEIKKDYELVVTNDRTMGITLDEKGLVKKVCAETSFGLTHPLEDIKDEILTKGKKLVVDRAHKYD